MSAEPKSLKNVYQKGHFHKISKYCKQKTQPDMTVPHNSCIMIKCSSDISLVRVSGTNVVHVLVFVVFVVSI